MRFLAYNHGNIWQLDLQKTVPSFHILWFEDCDCNQSSNNIWSRWGWEVNKSFDLVLLNCMVNDIPCPKTLCHHNYCMHQYFHHHMKEKRSIQEIRYGYWSPVRRIGHHGEVLITTEKYWSPQRGIDHQCEVLITNETYWSPVRGVDH